MQVEIITLTRSDLADLLAQAAEAGAKKALAEMPAPAPAEYLTPKQAAAVLGYKSVESIRGLVNSGRLKKHFINGQPRYLRAEVAGLAG